MVFVKPSFFSALILSLSLVSNAHQILFFNGKILSNFSRPNKRTSQMLVEDGRVLALGNHLKHQASAKRWDLKKKWVFPSFIDSHAHLLASGEEFRGINLRNKSLEEIKNVLVSSLKSNPGFLVGFGWDQTIWPQKKFPEISFLDQISTKIPIVLYRVDGHAAWANTFALQKAGLSTTQAMMNNPIGIIVDLGLKDLEKIIPDPNKEEIKSRIKEVVSHCLSLGITAIHDAGISEKNRELLKELIKEDNLPFRFYEMGSVENPTELENSLQKGPEIGLLNDRYHFRTIKIFIDGAMGSRGALLQNPYQDAPNTRGVELISQSELENLVRKADKRGFQIAVHAIGDYANQIAVNVFDKVWGKNTKIKRPRIEHAQLLNKNLIERMGTLGIVASMQPIHCSSDSKWVADRIGEARSLFAYPWHSLLNAKVPLAFGSDSPVEDFSPWWGLYAATTRMPLDSVEKTAFNENEKISLPEAFNAYTSGAAYSSFQETSLGSLETGKWADFIVLDKNPIDDSIEGLKSELVRATFFAGELAFERN